jgi:hypothetical protein
MDEPHFLFAGNERDVPTVSPVRKTIENETEN